ncbi:4'-phosphopantetheinyl transferase superfamily protein [Ruania halotolerans]|uniref:4'-phosphopantetheinyl transferase superfamily protein n=1 Tax=Ruania halotolerans TaxID=2897773 RepID=UPI001E65473F|nr:4'-phosphopantetheinyl transferase superfamily protein [Ruania halotolerans]UFU05889.1 4'-phosphopantetheinyl transferase superfamily protein [Ruania halotolerans]
MPTYVPVSVRWHCAESSTAQALREHLGTALAMPAVADLRVGHLCPACGGSDHGRPWARVGSLAIPVSAARAGPHLLTVADLDGAAIGIGADVEQIASISVDSSLVRHPDESSRELLGLWVAKEAILKMLGTGLSVPMPTIRAADFRVQEIPAPSGFTARVCVG